MKIIKKQIFLLLKKIKINKEYLLSFYLKNNLELEIKNTDCISISIHSIVEFEKFIDSILKYIKHKEPGLLYNLSTIQEKEKIRVIDFFIVDGYYIQNISEVNLRILKKIEEIKKENLKLDPYHSRSIKTHIIILEDYLSVIF